MMSKRIPEFCARHCKLPVSVYVITAVIAACIADVQLVFS